MSSDGVVGTLADVIGSRKFGQRSGSGMAVPHLKRIVPVHPRAVKVG